MSQLDQPISAFTDAGGRALPLLRTRFGSTKVIITSTTPVAEQSIHNNSFMTPVRLWSVGQQHRYLFGATGMGAPGATDGFIDAGAFIETYMLEAEKFLRVASIAGAGQLIVEVLA